MQVTSKGENRVRGVHTPVDDGATQAVFRQLAGQLVAVGVAEFFQQQKDYGLDKAGDVAEAVALPAATPPLTLADFARHRIPFRIENFSAKIKPFWLRPEYTKQ